MSKYKLKSITLEKEDGSIETIDLDMENVSLSIDCGVRKEYVPGSPVPGMTSNGQSRIKILASSGCEDYDSFWSD